MWPLWRGLDVLFSLQPKCGQDYAHAVSLHCSELPSSLLCRCALFVLTAGERAGQPCGHLSDTCRTHLKTFSFLFFFFKPADERARSYLIFGPCLEVELRRCAAVQSSISVSICSAGPLTGIRFSLRTFSLRHART